MFNILNEIKAAIKNLRHLVFLHKITTGTSVQSGDGVATVFTIEHGLGVTPTFANVQAGSSAAKTISHITVDSTNITVHYAVAPANAADNLTFFWSVRK